MRVIIFLTCMQLYYEDYKKFQSIFTQIHNFEMRGYNYLIFQC